MKLLLLILLPVFCKGQSFTVSKPDTVRCVMLVADTSIVGHSPAYSIPGYKVYTRGRWQPYAEYYFIDDKKQPLKSIIVFNSKEL